MFTVDLHTHSVASNDGGITEKEYEKIIAEKKLDFVAITDHNRIDFAQKMQGKLGSCIIVGEEIMTESGEIIGLFLKETIAPHMSILDTIGRVRAQNGLVYVPHPFDTFRHSIGKVQLLEYMDEIDIIEGFNARIIFRWQNVAAARFANAQHIAVGVGSDAHTLSGIGAYALIAQKPTAKNIEELLKGATYNPKYQPFAAYFAPMKNKIKNNV